MNYAPFALLCAILLVGCAAMPPTMPPPGRTPKPIQPVENPVRVISGAMQIRLTGDISGSCARRVTIQTTGKAKVADLAPLLYTQGIAFVYGKSGGKSIYLPRWSGSICRFGAMLAGYLNGSWSWNGHTLTVGAKREVTGYVPASLVKIVKKDLSTLGVPVDVSALGVFSGSLDRNQYATLRAYFTRLRSGVALVTLQVAAVSLHESYARGGGFSWQAFSATLGSPKFLGALGGVAAAVAGGSAVGGHAGVSAPAATGADTPTGAVLSFKGGKLSVKAGSPRVSVSAIIDLLSTYGKITLLQNASIQALSGTRVELKSVTNTPYVSGIGISGYGTNSENGSGDSGSGGIGLANTSTATAGLTLKITPTYSPGQSFVTLKIKASLDSVQQFVNLSAGNQIGSLTQPVTQNQSLDSSVAVSAGAPAVIGGLVYTSRNTQQAAPNGFYGLSGKSVKQTRDRLFIIVRPTVTIYRPTPR